MPTVLKQALEETPRQWTSKITLQKADLSQPELVSKQFGYTPTGNMRQYYDDIDTTQSMLLDYDKVNQLTSALGPWGQSTMTYDKVGNLAYYSVGSRIAQMQYGSSDNRLATIPGRNVTYDVYGNISNDGWHAYQFDDASNLTCVDCGTGHQITYTYDGNNRRVTQTKGSETTYYVNAANGDLLLEYTTPSNQAIQHFYLNGKRVASKRVQL